MTKIKETLIISVISLVMITLVSTLVGHAFHISPVWAKTITTSVTVGNSSPTFTVNATEAVSSDTTTPTNVGTTVTFRATATDSNNENWYLAICKTNTVTAVNGSAPTCPGTSWCITGATSSGAQAQCSYTPTNADAESNDWYAFACDGNSSSAACSAVSPAGSNPSPFNVNHPPTFSAIANNTPQLPGANITWTTGVGTSDRDTTGTPDTVKLVVCKTTGVSAGDCDGGASDRWCQSSGETNNPSCTYTLPIPTTDQAYNAYAYVFDAHNLGSSGPQAAGSDSNFTVSNATPSIGTITLNSGAAIALDAGATTPVVLGATITDNNGCSDLTTVVSSVYRSSVGFASCDTVGEQNYNNCYPVISCSTSNCSSGASADYTCTAYFRYHADPTTAGTPYDAQNWLNTFRATDNNAAVGTSEISTGVELNTLLAYDFSSDIAYGSLNVGQRTDPLSVITLIYAQGNTGLDQLLSGTDMSDGSGHYIPIGYQKYALAPSTAYASGTALSNTPTTSLINALKPTVDTGTSKPTYWGLEIPNGTVSGTYSGTNDFTAQVSAAGNW